MAMHRRRAPLPRVSSGLLAAVLLVALVIGVPVSPAIADSGTYVRLAQLAPDMTGVTMTVTSAAGPAHEVMLPAVGYGGLSEYQRLDPGDYVVAVRRAGSTAPAAVSSALEARPGTAYTLAAVGTSTISGLTVFTDDLTPPAAGRARVRVIAAAPARPAVDVLGPGGSTVQLGLRYGQASAYQTVAAGTLDLTAGAPGSPATPVAVPVAANQVVTVVLVAHNGVLAARSHVDAAGPTAMPPGAMDAGYGGAADPHGPVGEALLAVLAVGAAGLAAVQRLRGGRARRTPPGTC